MSAKNSFIGIKALVFDAYGTLFDVHSAVGKYREAMGGLADQVSTVWRTKQLEYTWLRSLMGRHADFWQVTGDALDFALEMHKIKDTGLRRNLMDAYLQLSCYPEIPATLATLKSRGYRQAILSNGTPRMLEAAVKNSGLSELIEQSYSVEQVGIFKPDPSVYRIATETMGLQPEEILFHSANAWDACGASVFGFKVAWINRFGQKSERLPGKADIELRSLEQLLEVLD